VRDRIAVVSDENRFLYWTDRVVVHRDRLPHRSVHVILWDSRGRLVVQRRHPGKLTNPDAWDLSASGHVEEDDYHAGPDDGLDAVYARTAAREVREELGVDATLVPVARLAPEPGIHYEHIALYSGVHDGPYVAQPEEVAEIRAVTAEELRELLAGARVTGTMRWMVGRGFVRVEV
jgi:isopentenyldiphosphate isomerase